MIDPEKRCKHLTDEEREMIQNGLNMGMTFKAIAKRIGKDQTTVSKEVKKHIEIREARSQDGKMESPCEKLMKAPFVCNGCRKTARCKQERRFYVARKAHEAYRTTLVEARTGIILNSEEFYDADRKLTEALKNGQHLYHALKATGVKMGTSSAYRYVQKGYMSFSRIDLPRAVKFKPRKKQEEPRLTVKQKENHTYDKFLDYCEEEAISSWVETDTVIGRPGGKVLMCGR